MSWRKLGLIYDPDKWEGTAGGGYGANPIAVTDGDNDVIRIYFNIRDEKNRAHVTYLDYNMNKQIITEFTGNRIISPGELGTFDECGCSLGCILDNGDEYYMYYLGWNLPKTVPFMNTIGLAIYDKASQTCRKYSPAAIMDRSSIDPYSLSYSFVRKEDDKYRMWYGSNLTWGNTTFEHYDYSYGIKYAESADGIHFDRTGIICLGGEGCKDDTFARPSVLFEDGLYKIWYTYRGDTFKGDAYHIGYAESKDGITFARKDEEVNIEPSEEAWESEEVSYPFVFSYKGLHYMLYCGNAYGKTGFGLAVEE